MFSTLPRSALALTLASIAMLQTSCSVGPRRLAPARFDYNQAIARSLDEQLLLNLVRLRYRDTPVFLEMSTLVNQYTLRADASVGPTFVSGGVDEVGAGAGVAFTETPTIGYTQLQGQEFATRILSPIAPLTIMLLSSAGWSIERLLGLAAHEINGVRNAPSAAGPTPETPPDYEAFQELSRSLRELQLVGLLETRADLNPEGLEQVILAFSAPSTDREREALERVKSLLGLGLEVDEARIVSDRVSGGGGDELVVRGRSLLAAMFFLSQGVEPPEQHETDGKVTVTRDEQGELFDWSNVVGGLLRIRSSLEPPVDAFVAIQYRDHWFYIDDSDLNSKTTFNLMNYLFSLQASSGQGRSPLLTLPAGR